jgi:hypothetical protein
VFVQFTCKRSYAGREYTSEIRMLGRNRTPPGGGRNPDRKVLLFGQQDRIPLPGRRINLCTQHQQGAARTGQPPKQSGDHGIRQSAFPGDLAGENYLKAFWNTGSPVIVRNRKIKTGPRGGNIAVNRACANALGTSCALAGS